MIVVSHSLRKLDGNDNDYSLEIKVIDNGIGVDKKEIDNLFKPF